MSGRRRSQRATEHVTSSAHVPGSESGSVPVERRGHADDQDTQRQEREICCGSPLGSRRRRCTARFGAARRDRRSEPVRSRRGDRAPTHRLGFGCEQTGPARGDLPDAVCGALRPRERLAAVYRADRQSRRNRCSRPTEVRSPSVERHFRADRLRRRAEPFSARRAARCVAPCRRSGSKCVRHEDGSSSGSRRDHGSPRRPVADALDPKLIDIIFPVGSGYHPDGLSWQDAGRFFSEGTEFFDPIQGFVGDCYFIAAMSSVAWSMPYVIADQVRATGADNEQFTHQVSFHGDSGIEHVETTDRILVDGSGSTYFCRSKEPGEIWPAVYEKAYAKWRLGEASDYPAIPSIAGGDASIACKALTGLSDYRYWHDSYAAADILQLVKAHCVSGRTTTPMIAWTYNSGPAADVAYTDANVSASHAYSVLGWLRRTEFFNYFDPSDFIPHYVPIDGPGPIGPDPGSLRSAPSRAGVSLPRRARVSAWSRRRSRLAPGRWITWSCATRGAIPRAPARRWPPVAITPSTSIGGGRSRSERTACSRWRSTPSTGTSPGRGARTEADELGGVPDQGLRHAACPFRRRSGRAAAQAAFQK